MRVLVGILVNSILAVRGQYDCDKIELPFAPDTPYPGKTGIERFIKAEDGKLIWPIQPGGLMADAGGTCHHKPATDDFGAMLIRAASKFPEFANTGNYEKDKRELAAFLAHASQETTGGWSTAPCGSVNWGGCFIEEIGCINGDCSGHYQNVCDPQVLGYSCPPVAGKSYHGRGYIQLSHPVNYAGFSKHVTGDPNTYMNNPEKVMDEDNPIGAAIYFWMTPAGNKPSCHDVMHDKWVPTADDIAQKRNKGFGATTNIVNGGLECHHPLTDEYGQKAMNRANNFIHFAKMLNVKLCNHPDDTITCMSQNDFALLGQAGLYDDDVSFCAASSSEGSDDGNGGGGPIVPPPTEPIVPPPTEPIENSQPGGGEEPGSGGGPGSGDEFC